MSNPAAMSFWPDMRARAVALHITSADLRLQSRIDRITRHLKARGHFANIEVAGIRSDGLSAIEIQDDGRIYRRFAVRKWLREASRATRALDFLIWYLEILPAYIFRPIACVNAHTLSVLPLCWILSVLKGCSLIYEPHELETETQVSRGAAKTMLRRVESLFIRRAARVIAVNAAIADWYRQTYGLTNVYAVRNLPEERARDPLPRNYYASHFGFPPSHKVFLYQGLIDEGRGVELLLAAAARLAPDRHIVFLGFGPGVAAVEDAARRLPNVHYHHAVPSAELLRYSAAADAGLMMIENVSLSYRLCYPNKYCEYLTAGVPVICSDFLWLRAEVERYDCGWSCGCDADALADLLSRIDADAIGAKKAGAAAWTRDNNWENEKKILDDIYAEWPARGQKPKRPRSGFIAGGASAYSRAQELGSVLRLPKQTITLSGGARGRAALERLTKPHAKLPLIQAKKYGVSLLALPQRYEDYMAGGERKYCRYMLRRTAQKGYTFKAFDPDRFANDLIAINGSATRRQDKEINPDYLDRDKVLEFHRNRGENWGVFDADGALCAYAVVPVYGEAAFLTRLLGHADHLDDGVMFRLVAEIVRVLIERRAEQGRQKWLCYDTYFGASGGLRLFKRRLGFSPAIVTWQWDGDAHD